MIETWKDCLGGVYAVSDQGNVKRVTAGPGARAGRLVKAVTDTHGYRRVAVSVGGKRCSISVHALVAVAFLGPRPAGYDVNHRNGNKTDNAVGNLEYVTRSENHRHAYRSCIRPAVGSKLSQAEAESIRRRYASGETQTAIAKSMGISQSLTSMVVSGERWRA